MSISFAHIHSPMHYILYAWLFSVLTLSCATDLACRRIPNPAVYSTMVLAVLVYSFTDGWHGLQFSLCGAAIGFIIFLLPYCLGGMGAGDVKLITAVGAVLGPVHTLQALLFIALSGGLIALVIIFKRSFTLHTGTTTFPQKMIPARPKAGLVKTQNIELPQDGIPYAVAIASGVILYHIYLILNQKTLSVFGL